MGSNFEAMDPIQL